MLDSLLVFDPPATTVETSFLLEAVKQVPALVVLGGLMYVAFQQFRELVQFHQKQSSEAAENFSRQQATQAEAFSAQQAKENLRHEVALQQINTEHQANLERIITRYESDASIMRNVLDKNTGAFERTMNLLDRVMMAQAGAMHGGRRRSDPQPNYNGGDDE